MARINLDNNINNPRTNGHVNAHLRSAVYINKRLDSINITIYSSAPLYSKMQHVSFSE